MKLSKIYFDAFKSLINKELEIKHDCIGFVGTNESGKSNILDAINTLNGNRKLTLLDTPKMNKNVNPSLRFQFILNEIENKEISTIIKDWKKSNTLYTKELYTELIINYNIIYNKSQKKEERYFSINGLSIDKNSWVLILDNISDNYKILNGTALIPINNAIIISDTLFNTNIKNLEIYDQIKKLSEEISTEENKLELLEPIASNEQLPNDNVDIVIIDQKNKIDVEKINQNITKLKSKKSELELKIKDFNLTQLIEIENSKILEYDAEILKLKNELKAIDELKKIVTPNEQQVKEISLIPKKQTDINNKLNDLELKKDSSNKIIKDFNTPLKEKYTNDSNELNMHLVKLISKPLHNFLPKVVYWEHSDKYILQTETLFKDLLNKSLLEDISRPLVNVFRIGLNIQSLEELKEKIQEIQTDSSERSRYEETINSKINEYLKKVWCDYDQYLKISLEKDQILIQIYDPSRKGASFYSMDERSQGCKTFLSFLFTIGVEAEHKVIKDTILILDEPETHLHPSGVRFMLQELIKISEKGNLVFYATHSIFLIDRKSFDRHIIVTKEKENTILKPSNVGRLGYFMQEEVLYNTLDFNLGSDFSSTNKFNFVFEGDGDGIIFEHYYNKIITKDRPFNIKFTSFHQGGKCSDIQKYLTNRPIQLGTKWIFILDKDNPGNELKKFIEGKYKNYLNSDIYIFQYDNKNKTDEVIELEDLFQPQFIISSYLETIKSLSSSIDESTLNKIVTDSTNYCTYNDLILKNHINNVNIDEFKAKFKEILNSKIRISCDENKTEESFKIAFPEYYNWISELISKLTIKA